MAKDAEFGPVLDGVLHKRRRLMLKLCVLSEKGLYKIIHLLCSHLAYVIITVVASLSQILLTNI